MSSTLISIPDWLLNSTFGVQYNPNCPSKWLVRLVGIGGFLDWKHYAGKPPETKDAFGFGKTITEAAENARKMQTELRSKICSASSK
jgi:hypothetical protein